MSLSIFRQVCTNLSKNQGTVLFTLMLTRIARQMLSKQYLIVFQNVSATSHQTRSYSTKQHLITTTHCLKVVIKIRFPTQRIHLGAQKIEVETLFGSTLPIALMLRRRWPRYFYNYSANNSLKSTSGRTYSTTICKYLFYFTK